MQRFLFHAVAVILAAVLAAPAGAQSRGRVSPYVMTPYGPMLRSQYMLQTMQFVDPAMIAQMQAIEQQMLNRGRKPVAATPNNGAKSIAGKPIATKK